MVVMRLPSISDVVPYPQLPTPPDYAERGVHQRTKGAIKSRLHKYGMVDAWGHRIAFKGKQKNSS